GFCWSDQKLMDVSGRFLGERVVIVPEGVSQTTQILTSGWSAPPSCWLVRRNLLAVIGGFDENLPMGHDDVELMFRMAANAKGTRACEALVYRRIRADSLSKKVVRRKEYVRVVKTMLSYQNGKYQHLRRETMHAIHYIRAAK